MHLKTFFQFMIIGLEITAAFLRQYSKPMRLRTLSTRVNGTKPDMEGWTVDRTLRESIERLQANNVTEPEQSVPHLLSASLGLSWKSGYREISTLSKDVALTKEQAHDFAEKLNRRLNHEPLQYILGQWDFLDYTIAIEPPLLCPRPETEELVMKVFKEANPNPTQILDVGCGTGVIGVSLAAKLPNATVEAIDIDPVAVKVSMQNAKRILGTSPDSRYKVNLCAARDYVPDRRFDIVVSNPPYIPKADMTLLSEDVAQYESESALCGGIDGMDVIRTILKQLPKWCNCGAVCWMEVDPTHPQIIEQWIGDSDLPVEFESSYKDMFGKERFVKLSIL